MDIIARCHPDLADLLPPPVLARAALPVWLREMPGFVAADSLGGEDVRTVKQCPPFLDALGAGLLMRLPCDIVVTEDEMAWDWPFPVITDAPLSRAPLGVHVPEQAVGTPFDPAGALVVKFMNFWTLETPPGVSLLFCHPLNRGPVPFKTLAGIVDCDRFSDGYVHFPALLDPGFVGTLLQGTPVAQVIPIASRTPGLKIEPMSDTRIAASRRVQEALGAEPGVYRKHFRRAGVTDGG